MSVARHAAGFRIGAAIVVFTIVVAAVTYALLSGEEFTANGLAISLMITGGYVLIMCTAQLGTGAIAERFFPLRTRRDVAIRVAAHAVVMVISFGVATFALRLAFDYPFLSNRWSLTLIALVAMCASLVGHGARYLDLFYRRTLAAEKTALNAQLRALRAQINPHFLFNSLNSIAALIRLRPEEAESIIESLADLFRYSLRASEHPTASLGEELESVNLYLAIEHARFGDRLRVEVDVPDAVLRTPVPSLLLQPLVENAVKHGAGAIAGECTITLAARERGDRIQLSVTDTGPGFGDADPRTIMRRGAGLANVRDRLALQFDAAGSLTILQNGVMITIPRTSP